ncbi:Protein AAR2 -like protein [Halotydeus destructor]|nr:Protein AAR2 -like protein [Halotydeus destructor]
MDNNVALAMVKAGATFVLDNFPKGFEFGIDMTTFTVGEKFKGVKMIPPGCHFVYYSAVNIEHNSVGARSGFFQYFKSGELIAKKWNVRDEDVADVDEEEILRYRESLIGDLDRHLAPYPQANYEKWSGLVDYIDESVLNRLSPTTKQINSVSQMVPRDVVSSSSSITPEPVRDPKSTIKFTAIPTRCIPDESDPKQVTVHSIDSSFALNTILVEMSDNQLLGEFQYAFVCFLVGQVYDAFEHWKSLLKLFCSCDKAISEREGFFSDLIRILHFQLREVPEDLFVDIVEQNNFLVAYLSIFFSNLNSSSVSIAVRRRGERFKENLKMKYKWDFDFEPEDEAPVIVEM